MNVLIIGGGGGREAAITWKLAQDSRIKKLYCAPGNGGIAEYASCVNISSVNTEEMVVFAKENRIDLAAVVGDDALASGMVNALSEAGIRAFGATREASKLEWSKIFAKSFMERHNIPTARHASFTEKAKALEYLQNCPFPAVIKADGLALGKGVIIAQSLDEARTHVCEMMESKKFSGAGAKLVIEEFMEGREVSAHVFTDGKSFCLMPSCRDHKRAFDGDKGANTGGMGVISPVLDYTKEVEEIVIETIIMPTLEGMRAEGTPFSGVLYFELMLTHGGPKVIEYNARFGDPEAQVLMLLLETDLLDIFEAVIEKRLDSLKIKWKNAAAAIVIAASPGYPDKSETGHEITGIAGVSPEVTVFQAGTAKRDGKLVTSGGRVLGLASTGDTLKKALDIIYRDISKINFYGIHYRLDIGRRELK